MPFKQRRVVDDLDELEVEPETDDYLSDLLATMERVETHLNELVNQGDKQVEFLSRLVTLFEGAAREARNG